MKKLRLILHQLLFAKYFRLLISGLVAAMVIVALVLIAQYRVSEPLKQENKEEVKGISTDYTKEAKIAVSEYQDFLNGEKSETDIKNRRDHLLSLKVSKENQALHLALVMMADDLLSNGNNKDTKNRGRVLLTKLITDYPSLSN